MERLEDRDGSYYIEGLVPEKPHLKTYTNTSTSPLTLKFCHIGIHGKLLLDDYLVQRKTFVILK